MSFFLQSSFCQRFQLKFPVIQAPMAGGIATPALVAAVCKAGGFGFLPLGYLNPEQAFTNIRAAKKLTTKPFGVNVFVPASLKKYSQLEESYFEMIKILTPYYKALHLSIPDFAALKNNQETSVEALAEIAAAERVAAFSFTFGIPELETIQFLKRKNIYVMGTACTVKEGMALQEAGCDAIIAQGYEAGGHRGSFLDFTTSGIKRIPLLQSLLRSVKIPIISAGGIMDGRAIAETMSMGADAVQMGTAFMLCKESGTTEAQRQTLRSSIEGETDCTDAITGKPARGLFDELIQKMIQEIKNKNTPILDYPFQHWLTQNLRRATRSVWAGTGSHLSSKFPPNIDAKQLLEKLHDEMMADIPLSNTMRAPS